MTFLTPLAANSAPIGTVACPHCASLQAVRPGSATVIACRTCGSELERTTGRTLDASFAAASATFLLLFPANGLVFLETAIAGATRHSYLASGPFELWREGWPALAILLLLVLVVVPFPPSAPFTLALACLSPAGTPTSPPPPFLL